MTINGARGFDRSIADRFDLTLECLRRYYLGEPSPTGLLGSALARYPKFFALFGDFEGLWTRPHARFKFFTPFEGFTTSPLPGTLDAYRGYRERSIEFIEARNDRIAAHDRRRPSVVAP